MPNAPGFTLLAPDAGVVDAPASGVESRAVHLGADGLRVVVFTFAAGARLMPHAAPRAAVIEARAGVLDVTLGDRRLDLPSGASVYMDAGLVHAVTARTDAVMRLTVLPA